MTTPSRHLLQHFLAALAYRTQKALRGAPAGFGDFRVAPTARTPHELLAHMTHVIAFARATLHGDTGAMPQLPSFADEIARFHDTLAALHADFGNASLAASMSDERLLQGPLSDAMTHAGQLAMLRRLAGSPVPAEDFTEAQIDSSNVGSDQPLRRSPARS
ncbi:MAG: hypothetical protein ACJ79A_06305 [Gemmatimonadaceae bacterium]